MKYLEKLKYYTSKLNLLDTEIAIKFVKDNFEKILAEKLSLTRVSAPLFVTAQSGINDYLSGWERVVSFDAPSIKDKIEIVQSLAKWKRMSLKKYNFLPDTGLYTDMNAIRRDEVVDAIHSIYVDQWDWERIITKDERNINYLFRIVKLIYEAILDTNSLVKIKFPILSCKLPSDIYFISSSELEKMYPSLSPKMREYEICKSKRAVFIYQIGGTLKSGIKHDERASDYDDWNLNGDILVWNDVISSSFELSSMGIRVDAESLKAQLLAKNEEYKLNNEYCQMIINDLLPLTIGGGIGQSRLCMLLLEKAHIGEVQVSIWDDDYLNELSKKNVHLL